jgi:hypothetical protein
VKPTLRFLQVLFGSEMTGVIEVRLIEERTEEMKAAKRKPKVVGIYWYSSPEALLDQLEFLLEQAKIYNAAIFFGVLRRKERGKGKAEGVLPGWIVWVDLDAKDFPDGMEGLRRKLAEFPIPPSIIVASAHGLHAYWLLREEHDSAELSAVSKLLAAALGGDHAFDAARLLRLPGSFNRKDPEHPVEATIEKLEPELRYNLSELTDALDMSGAATPAPAPDPSPVPAGTDTAATAPAEPAPLAIAEAISPRVQALIAFDPKVHGYYHGQGKREKDENGKQLDNSSSGYDFSFAMSLISNGVTDPPELGTAIWHRQDGGARTKGADYIARTVQRALALAAGSSKAATGPLGFTVGKVTIYTSNPPQYEFVIDGVVLKLTARDLQNRGAFGLRFLEALNRIPSLPKPAGWSPLVNSWLAKAEKVEQPPDASQDGALREAVERAIEGLSIGEAVEDLDRGQALRLEDERLGFKTSAVLTALQSEPLDATRDAVCRVLKELGYASITFKFPTKAVRVWARPEHPEARAREES